MLATEEAPTTKEEQASIETHREYIPLDHTMDGRKLENEDTFFIIKRNHFSRWHSNSLFVAHSWAINSHVDIQATRIPTIVYFGRATLLDIAVARKRP